MRPTFLLAAASLAAPALLASVLSATPALAAPPLVAEPAPETLDKAIPARFIMGVKFGGGGTLWDEPDGTVLGKDERGIDFDTAMFDETRAGYTMSAGFFLEGIFYDHLGLEVGFNFVQHTLLENVKWSYEESNENGLQRAFNAKSDQELTWTALHVPILVKAVVDAGKTRVSLGVGPEFSFTSWSQARFKITEGALSSTAVDDPNDHNFPRKDGAAVYPQCYDGQERLPGGRCVFSRLKAKNEDSVYLAVVFGIEITAGDFIIPIDIHWSYNFSQPKGYLERASLDPNTIPTEANGGLVRPDELELKTRDSMYGGLRVGLAYQF